MAQEHSTRSPQKPKLCSGGSTPCQHLPLTLPAISCGVSTIPHVQQTKYLGLVLNERTGVSAACKLRRQNMSRAWMALRRRYAALRCSLSLHLILHLYMTCVPPVGSYGCEIWGCLKMAAGDRRERDAMQTEHMQRVRSMAGIRCAVPVAIVYRELGIQPLHHLWLDRQITFWNNLTALRETSLFRKVLIDGCVNAEFLGVRNWVWEFQATLEKYGYVVHRSCVSLVPIERSCFQVLLRLELDQPFQGLDVDPRTCPSSGVMCCTYARWFTRPKGLCKSFLNVPVPISLVRRFIQFRTGSHCLPVVLGRFQAVPRSQRLCTVCSMNVVCDEFHVVFECPALLAIRQKYSNLFSSNVVSLRQFIWQKDIVRVMLFVRDCLRITCP